MWLKIQHRNVMLTSLLALLFAASAASVFSETDVDLKFATKVPAVQLMPNWSEPVTFATVTIYEGEIIDVDHHSADTFIRIYTGAMSHRYNPNQTDFFTAHGIPDCAVEFDTIFNTSKSYCSTLNQLWKLRYQQNPRTREPGGWARKGGAPDDAQLSLLRPFGIERLNDFCAGEHMWLLLQALNDPAWQTRYH